MNLLPVSQICAFTIVLTTQVMASSEFSASSAGADWQRASLAYRRQYCDRMAVANQRLAPGITGKFIFDSLQEFYRTTEPSVLNTKIVEIVALTVTVYGK